MTFKSNNSEYACINTTRRIEQRRKRQRSCGCTRTVWHRRKSSSSSSNNNVLTTGLFYCMVWILLSGGSGLCWWRRQCSSSSSISGTCSSSSCLFVTAWSFLGFGPGGDASRIQPHANGLAVASSSGGGGGGGGTRVVPFVQAVTSRDISSTSSAATSTSTTITAATTLNNRMRKNSHNAQKQQLSSSPDKVPTQQQPQQQSRSNFPWGWLLFGNKRQNHSISNSNTIEAAETASAISAVVAAQAMNDLTLWNRRSQSVHLQLNPPTMPAQNEGNSNNLHQQQQQQPSPHNKNATKTVQVITYKQRCRHGLSSLTWTALNTSPAKFQAFLRYRGVYAMPQDFTTQQVSMQQAAADEASESAYRAEWRELWTQERLLTDRTELLAIYPSDTNNRNTKDDDKSATNKKPRRGGFVDHLYLYVDRLLGILRDEQDLAKNATITTTTTTSTTTDNKRRPSSLADWLVSAYGKDATRALYAAHLCGKSEMTQLTELKTFLEWFRSEYPYYYDRCGTCGASLKEELAARVNGNVTLEEDGAMDNEADRDDQCFLGYIYPNSTELVGKASRTELYQCHRCASYTRFPRYNSAFHVIDNRRGRCGEYSVLLFEILRALGHEARWIVDWTDHVWVEIKLIDSKGRHRWVHLDPCEAAVDENYLYQSWGKKQTYILAFYAPRNTIVSTEKTVPFIEDVTQSYTTDSWKEICKRRDESEENVKTAIRSAASYLRRHLEDNNYAESSVKLK